MWPSMKIYFQLFLFLFEKSKIYSYWQEEGGILRVWLEKSSTRFKFAKENALSLSSSKSFVNANLKTNLVILEKVTNIEYGNVDFENDIIEFLTSTPI